LEDNRDFKVYRFSIFDVEQRSCFCGILFLVSPPKSHPATVTYCFTNDGLWVAVGRELVVLPLNTWLREGMSGLLNDVLSPNRLSIHAFFNQEYVASLIANFQKGDDASTFKIWALVIFQFWYQDYLSA
jgi:hypothetical protein